MKVLEIALLVASASTLQADILYNNTTNASSGVDCLSNSSTNTGCQTGPVSNGHFYDSFTSGAVAERLSDLKLVIDADPTSSGILDIGSVSRGLPRPDGRGLRVQAEQVLAASSLLMEAESYPTATGRIKWRCKHKPQSRSLPECCCLARRL